MAKKVYHSKLYKQEKEGIPSNQDYLNGKIISTSRKTVIVGEKTPEALAAGDEFFLCRLPSKACILPTSRAVVQGTESDIKFHFKYEDERVVSKSISTHTEEEFGIVDFEKIYYPTAYDRDIALICVAEGPIPKDVFIGVIGDFV